MFCSVVYLDKPLGPTSHQIDCWIKEITNLKKVGHVGTLDPHASGALPILLGKATKLTKYLQTSDKEYVFLIDSEINKDYLKFLTGKIYQKPPKESAVKKEIRIRKIYYIDVIEEDKNYTILKSKVQHGTYIRSIVRDLSRLHGKKIKLLDLRRTRAGNVKEEDCITLQKFELNFKLYKKTGNVKYLFEIMQPIENIMSRFKSVEIKKSTLKNVLNGMDIFVPGIKEYDRFNKGEVINITFNKKIIAVGKAMCDWKNVEENKKIKAIKTETVLGLRENKLGWPSGLRRTP